MAKKKFYGIKTGRNIGVFDNWKDAEEQIKGFSKAEYKSFNTHSEAENYILSNNEKPEGTEVSSVSDINKDIEQQIKSLSDDKVIAFVDGSYSENVDGKEKYGFGAILFTGRHEHQLYKAYDDSEYMSSRNVAGEVIGVMESISWAVDNKKKTIDIFYDYEGIEKWAKNEWKAKTLISKYYVNFINEKSNVIEINFIHTKAHSGIIHNERADKLAKNSLNAGTYKLHNDGSVSFIGLTLNDWTNIINAVTLDNKNFAEDETIKEIVEAKKEHLNKIEVVYKNSKVVINCYRGDKSFVQGKQSVLFQKIMSYAVEKLPKETSVIECLNNYHTLTIKKNEVETKLKKMMPDFPNEITDIKHYNNLLSAAFNSMLDGYMPDYTCLISPVFRAMEYYLHKILGETLGHQTVDRNGKNNFGYFNKNNETNSYFYSNNENNATEMQINYLNKLYNNYNKVRHPYSHWSKHSIDTPVIANIEVARELIIDSLKLINTYYSIFNL